MAKGKYTKGTVVQVFDQDANGFPKNHVEMDTDGQHWHVVAGKEPVAVDADELDSIGAESTQGRHDDHNNRNG